MDAMTIDPTTGEAEVTAEFHIHDEHTANWLVGKLAAIDAERARIKAQCAQRLKELEADEAGLKYRFWDELQEWVRQRLASEGNQRKRMTLLQGSCSYRRQGAYLKLRDVSEALAHAKALGLRDVVKVTESLDIPAYIDYATREMQDTGAIAPGVDRVPERESFSISFGKPEPAGRGEEQA